MNKTVTINISGIVFHIEEDAFERLRNYLDTLHQKFSKEEGRDEILADIEARIAELLKAKTGFAREVILMKDVEEVIAVMGEPEEISDEGSANTNQESVPPNAENANYDRKKRRRLFRDADDKVVGGVCSGLGHYFDVDAVWIRLGFALMFFLGGTGILFYLLLMIIIPRAETTAEKLEMRGEPVDVNNIHRSIKEEFEEFGNRMKGFGKEAKDWGKHTSDNIRHRSRYRRQGAEDILHSVFRGIGRLFAFCLVFFGVIILIGLLTSTFTITDLGPEIVRLQFSSLFGDNLHYTLAIFAFLLFFGMPVLMMIYSGIRMLFNIKTRIKWVGYSALALWITGVILVFFTATHIAQGFSEIKELEEQYTVADSRMDTVSVSVSVDPSMMNTEESSRWSRRHGYDRRWRLFRADENSMKFGYARLNIIKSTSDSIELVVFKKSNGRTINEALNYCSQINYPVTQNASEFIFPSAFTIGKNNAWKGQEVEAELRLPIGAVVYLDATCEDLIFDIKNVTNTLDEEMVDRRWKMTANGLECIDCAGLDVERKKQTIHTAPVADTIIQPADTLIIHH